MRTTPLFGALASKNEAQKIQMENKFPNNSTTKHNRDIGDNFPPFRVEKKPVMRIQSCKEMQNKRRKSSSLSSYHTVKGRQKWKPAAEEPLP